VKLNSITKASDCVKEKEEEEDIEQKIGAKQAKMQEILFHTTSLYNGY
jgi:hypothetical protein